MDGRIQQLFKEQQVNISDMSRRTGIPACFGSSVLVRIARAA